MNKQVSLTTGATAELIFPDSFSETSEKYMFYFHGGGFIYGSKSDCPQQLKDIFLNAGYTIIALDYLLAPNSSLQAILDTTWINFQECLKSIIKNKPYSLCGRSAGGYLLFSLTEKIIKNNYTLPQKIISFYGYTNLLFLKNSRNLYPQIISKKISNTLIRQKNMG